MIDADKTRLIAAVAARLKIRLDENDPAFVIVELNRLVLEQTVRDALQRVREFGPALQRRPGDQATADFAALVAQRVVAKLAEAEKRTSGPATESAYVRTAALACTLVLMLFAATLGYLLGVAHSGWQ